jgi:hypothetical protein
VTRYPTIAAACLTALLCCAAQARAQSAFIQGGIAIDARRFSGQPDERVFDGNVRSVSIGGGGFLTPRISAGVELDVGAELEVASSVSVTIAGRPQTITTTYASKRRTVSALFGLHSAEQRAIRVGAYAGLAFTWFDQRIGNDAPPVVLNFPVPESLFTHLSATPIVGVDVAVTLTGNVAIVGMVRAQALDFGGEPRGVSIRPGAAVRVSF